MEQRLGGEISGDVVVDVEDAVGRSAHRTLGMTQHQALARVGVRPDVRLEVAPRERQDVEPGIDDDAVRSVVALVLVDREVRVVDFRRGGESRYAGARADRKSTRLNSSHGYISY